MNHSIKSNTLNILATKTGSKNRVRIPVAGVRNTQVINPGDKVKVHFDVLNSEVVVQKVNRPRRCKKAFGKRNYTHTVEKNGAIRITAHSYSLPDNNIFISCDQMSGKIGMI